LGSFGCCGDYIKCSDEMKCTRIGNPEYVGCLYKVNLENGRIFYGKNAGKIINIVHDEISPQKVEIVINQQNTIIKNETYERFAEKDRLFLECYDRYFHVGHLGGNGFTYSLEKVEMETLIKLFTDNQIPHKKLKKTQLEESKCIMESDPESTNTYRVVISIPEFEQKFSIANFNSCGLIKKYVQGICKALTNKGIKSEIKVFSNCLKGEKLEISNKIQKNDISTPIKAETYKKQSEFKQITFFEILPAV
jgi:hypothetical protein